MTGFDLGPPDALDRGAALQRSLSSGALPFAASRRILQFEDTYGGDQSDVTRVAGAAATGVVDAGLTLLRGAQWVGIETGMLPEPSMRIPGTLQGLLPDDYAMRLESRLARAPDVLGVNTRKPAEIVGQIGTLIPTGGTSLLTLPGKAIGKLSIPGAKIGEKIIKIPAVAAWTRTSQALPGILGSSTGFGLYNYMTAEGGMEERMGAAVHGLMAGGAISILGRVANAAESKLLSIGTSEANAKTLSTLVQKMRAGEVPTSKALLEASQILGAKGVAGLIEGTGFASLDSNFHKNLWAGLGGDEEAWKNAMETYLGSVAGALVARSGRQSEFQTFRRENPGANDLTLRLEAESIRNAGKEPPPEAGSQDPGGQPRTPPGGGSDLVGATKPLFQSGWEIAETPRRDPNVVDVEFPGMGAARFSSDGTLEVSHEVYRLVRGKDADTPGDGKIKLSGPAAEEFTRDLAAVSSMRRMKGELLFPGQEAWAGGPWVGDDGMLRTIGLDGNVYSRGFPADQGEPWKKEPDLPVSKVPNEMAEDPQLQRWTELAQALHRSTAANPGLDMLDAALALATRGSPSSRSVQELQSFLMMPWTEGGAPNADAIAPLLTPQNIEQVGFVLAQLGSGHMTAEQAKVTLSEALIGPGIQQQPPVLPVEGEQPQPQADPQQQLSEIAGSKDWNALPRDERRAAAEDFARKAQESGQEVAPSALRDTFGVPTSTARDIIRRASEPAQLSYEQVLERNPILQERVKEIPELERMIRSDPDAYDAERSAEAFARQPRYEPKPPTESEKAAFKVEGNRNWWRSAKRDASLAPFVAWDRQGKGSMKDNESIAKEAVGRGLFPSAEAALADMRAHYDRKYEEHLDSEKQAREGFYQRAEGIVKTPAAGEARRDEAGFVRLPSTAELKEFGQKVASVPRKFYEPMTKGVARSGPAGQDIAKRAVRVVDETKRNLGKLGKMSAQTLRETTGVGLRNIGRGFNQDVKWAETVDWEGNAGEVRWKQLLEGAALDAPESVQRWAQTYRDVRVETGRMAQEAGTMRETAEGPQPFEPAPREVPLYLRQLDPGFVKLMKKGGPVAMEVAKVIASYKRNNIPPEVLLRDWTQKIEQIEREEAFEHFRELPDMPSHVRLDGGREITVLESTPYRSIKRMIEGSAGRAAFIKHVGQDLPQQVTGKPGSKRLLEALQREGGDVRQAEYLLAALQNISDRLPQLIPRPLRIAETMWRSAAIIGSAPLDLVEPLATIPQFTGYRNAIVGMMHAIGNWREVKQQLEDMGAITVEAGHHLMVEGKGIVGYATQKLGLPKQMAADAGAVWAGASVMKLLERLHEGTLGPGYKARLELALQRLEFTPAEIAEIMSGKADPALEKSLIRRFVASASGQLLRGERSMAGASQTFNTLFPFNRYFMNRFRHMAEVNGELAAAAASGNAKRMNTAVQNWWRAVTAATVAGAITLYIQLTMKDGPKDAAAALASEMWADPLGFLGRSFAASWIGGVPRQVLDTMQDKEGRGGMPSLILQGLWDLGMAFRGKGTGPYRAETPIEAIGTFIARSIPVVKQLDFVLPWLGVPHSGDMEGAISQLYDWKRIAGIQRTPAFPAPENEKIAEIRAMNAVAAEIKAKTLAGADVAKDKDIQAAINNALDLKPGRSIGQSLRGKMILPDLTPEQLSNLAAMKGEGVMKRLRAYDEALERIADVYRKVPRNITADMAKDLDEMLAVAKTAAIAGSAKGFKEAIGLVEEVWDARRLAGLELPHDELQRVSSLIADHPEVAKDLFTERDGRRIEFAEPSWRPTLIANLLRSRFQGGDRPVSAEKAVEKATSGR